jgi:TrmH family RNA methyltransferase
MGSEGRGISPAVSPFVSQRLFIPPYPTDRPAADRPDSLNVAISTAILLHALRK